MEEGSEKKKRTTVNQVQTTSTCVFFQARRLPPSVLSRWVCKLWAIGVVLNGSNQFLIIKLHDGHFFFWREEYMCLDSRAPSVLRLPCGVPVLMNHATKKGEATLSHCGTIFGDNGSRTLSSAVSERNLIRGCPRIIFLNLTFNHRRDKAKRRCGNDGGLRFFQPTNPAFT